MVIQQGLIVAIVGSGCKKSSGGLFSRVEVQQLPDRRNSPSQIGDDGLGSQGEVLNEHGFDSIGRGRGRGRGRRRGGL